MLIVRAIELVLMFSGLVLMFFFAVGSAHIYFAFDLDTCLMFQKVSVFSNCICILCAC